jgi:hypothetical protein
MRAVLLSMAFASLMTVMTPAKSTVLAASAAPAVAAAQTSVVALQVPDKTIEISVGEHGGGRWYKSPVWIAILAIGGVVVLLLLVMAVRGGGGTTIVKD